MDSPGDSSGVLEEGGQGCGGRNGVSFTSPSSRGSCSPILSEPSGLSCERSGGVSPPQETTRYRRARLTPTWRPSPRRPDKRPEPDSGLALAP